MKSNFVLVSEQTIKFGLVSEQTIKFGLVSEQTINGSINIVINIGL